MDDVHTRRDPTRMPVHPGEILREDVLPSLGRPYPCPPSTSG